MESDKLDNFLYIRIVQETEEARKQITKEAYVYIYVSNILHQIQKEIFKLSDIFIT